MNAEQKIAAERARKIEILLKHYTLDEILDILGYYDGSNPDVANKEMQELEVNSYTNFVDKIFDEAIINGNFEEVIRDDVRLAL
jgi:myosin heavy subunit